MDGGCSHFRLLIFALSNPKTIRPFKFYINGTMLKNTRNRLGIGRTEAEIQLHFVTGNCAGLLRKEYKLYMKVAFTGNK
jgi:hypothetical protein